MEFAGAWGKEYPAIVRLRENAWEEFTPFVRFDTAIRRVVRTTNAVESVNAGIRRDPAGSGGQSGPRPLPQRDRGLEGRPPGHHVAGSHRSGPGPLDHAWEDRPERPRHHLRRPTPSSPWPEHPGRTARSADLLAGSHGRHRCGTAAQPGRDYGAASAETARSAETATRTATLSA
ncbi:transposase [Streptomyces sp. NPDC006368]|uniref:transposase n=1 Tax=Streptomyces sp. NPDC006368 TaxID=3156760 RepID=UPI0033A3E869